MNNSYAILLITQILYRILNQITHILIKYIYIIKIIYMHIYKTKDKYIKDTTKQ